MSYCHSPQKWRKKMCDWLPDMWILCTSKPFPVSFVSPVGSIWRLCYANWASTRQLFALKWRQEPARSSWPMPYTSSSLRSASASLWCPCLSLCAISERLVSSNRPHLHPDDPSLSLCLLIKQQTSRLLMVIIKMPVHIITHLPSATNSHCIFEFRLKVSYTSSCCNRIRSGKLCFYMIKNTIVMALQIPVHLSMSYCLCISEMRNVRFGKSSNIYKQSEVWSGTVSVSPKLFQQAGFSPNAVKEQVEKADPPPLFPDSWLGHVLVLCE